jgi:outer membrane protein OmpA-like peptidoglycan-associated protein
MNRIGHRWMQVGLFSFALLWAPLPTKAGKAKKITKLLDQQRYAEVLETGGAYLAEGEHDDDDQVLLSVQQAAYHLATAEDSVEAYLDFLREHSGSPYTARVREQLSLVTFRTEVLPRNTVEVYRRFRQGFPGSSAVPEAYFREEEVAWSNARASDSVKAYQQFLGSYPGGRYAPFAQEREAELSYRAVRRADDLDTYLAFLREHPESSYADEARARSEDLAWSRAEQRDSVSGWHSFRTAFLEGERSRRAYARELELAWGETARAHTTADYRLFEHQYPETDEALLAEELEWNLYHFNRDPYPGELRNNITRAFRRSDGTYRIYVDVVDGSGQLVGGLAEQHFSIYDAGFGAELVDFAGMEQDRPLDVVFVVDISGSMSDEIEGVKQGIIRFAEIMRLRSRDFQLGLVTFVEDIFQVNGAAFPKEGLLTNDPRIFQRWVAGIGIASGSREDHLMALNHASRLNMREDAQRLMIVLSDEPPRLGSGIRDPSTVAGLLADRDVAVYCVTPDHSAFRTLVDGTGGALFTLSGRSDFSAIMEAISQKASKQYRLIYRRPPNAPPVIDQLQVKLRVRNDYAWLSQGGAAKPVNSGRVALFRSAWGATTRMFMAPAEGGLLCSDDGAVWSSCGVGLPPTALTELIVDPDIEGLVWGLTADGMVWVSTDAGENFSAAGLESAKAVALALDPAGSGSIFALDGRRVWSRSPQASWDMATLWQAEQDALVLATNPAGVVLLLARDGTLWRSTTGGKSYSQVAVPWGDSPPTRFAFHPKRKGLAFASGPGGLWRSLDDGASWRPVDLSAFAIDGAPVQVHQVVFDPTVRQLTLALTSAGVLASNDLGRGWYAQNTGVEGAEVAFGAFSPTGQAVLADASGGGIFGMERVANREFAFSDVFFASGSDVPHRSLWPHLDELSLYLKRNPQVSLRVEGHTDSDGSTQSNQALSERRARWVCDYLEKKGVRPSQLLSAGFGETQPLFSNQTAKGKASNRRVVLVMVSPQQDLPAMEGME